MYVPAAARRLRPRSLRGKLTALAALIAAGVFSTTSTLILSTVPGNLREAVESRAELVARRVASDARVGRLPRTLRLTTVPKRSFLVQVVDRDGRVVAGSEGMLARGRIAAFAPAEYEQIATREIELPGVAHKNDNDYLVVALRVRSSEGDRLVYTAANMSDVNRGLMWLNLLVYGGTPFAVSMVALVAWFTVGATLRPVRRIRRELEEISGQNLSRRVPVPAGGDEIARLAETTNATLERLERSAEAQRRFVADASHELRSPISALQTQLEVDGAYPDETDWPEANGRALRATRRLAAIVEELLMLARLDAGAGGPARRVVDVSRLAAEQIERRTNPRVHVQGDLAGSAPVLGSPVQLDRLLTNLLDNAVRHASERVDLEVEADGAQVLVTVTDDGDGIAAEDRERVFERFTRLAAGRRLDRGGSGLGLPLAREIAAAHGGTLEVAEHGPGARFVLCLPQAREES
ncbi:sensor histidine kinase [Actinomadura sp. 21ATH]|uniref:sensor histidine kinase n=1 Tax=Actinomadura sp. 21ATH TaxID=1735444 RepID=UPI0035BFB407